MNNIDRVAEEIRRRAEQESLAGIGAEDLVRFLLQIVDLEDRFLLKKFPVQQKVEAMVRDLARQIAHNPSNGGNEKGEVGVSSSEDQKSPKNLRKGGNEEC